ncbi:hypothetical protein [Actinomadura bangladeshensis]|uniref:DUF3159 domain-containing protein n=1 Tax=Actinomadura bangladeshensis TaxID=453573 RepID=A0A4V2XMR5_9ACTN|nr:hypothetical protein [Actinomadura bangladeshensis]TDC15276.1 hypothetical protein E1284_15890 [Actinomadura bangladeshensis]
MPKYYARTFLPWIVLAVVSGFDGRAGAAAGLVTALVLLGRDLRRGHRADSLILEISTSVYMAALTALALTVPDSSVLDYGASLAIGWLALTAWGTLLFRRPFTAGIARRQVSAEIAATALFMRINRAITAAWAASFTLTAVVLGLVQHGAPDATALLVAVKVACFTVPAVFTARHPDRARKRHATELGPPAAQAADAQPSSR